MEIFSNKYEFPSHHSWPFFFTLQKHAETRIKQLEMWNQILKEFCQVNKLWKISKQFFIDNIGTNAKINRKLGSEGLNVVLNYFLYKEKTLIQCENEHFFVLWKRIEEWEQCIYDSVVKHHRVDTLETLEYLMNDEEVRNEEYFGIEKDLLITILKCLEKKGKCKLLQDDSGNYMGVKFFKK